MTKKYEITDETHPLDPRLRRIRALRDIPGTFVRKGDFGGWIEHEGNLNQRGIAWVAGEARVYMDAEVFGDALIFGNAQVFGTAAVYDNARVYDNALIYGTAKVFEAASVYKNAKVSDNAEVSGNAEVFENAQVYEDAMVFGDALVFENAQVYGEAQVYGGAWACGAAQLYGKALIYGEAQVCGEARISIPWHFLHARVWATRMFPATLYPTLEGHVLTVGCWSGTVQEFRAMIESDKWVEADEATRALRRPELLAFTEMCEARIATW